jgi:uncharacterized protein (DUF362 family)
MTVSLVRFDGSLASIRKAIELCNGFAKLRRDSKVLLKPNNCFRHKVMPPYGMVTTSVLVEGVVQSLLEYGCNDITIGEGAIINIFEELHPYTSKGFKGTGIEKLPKKYGVKLVDFNEGPFQQVRLGGMHVEICKLALETDFLINLPVLKTHFQTKVSLGFKNLKGCLSQDSKKKFHTSKQLDTLICLLNEVIRTDLVIIDGIYTLEKGPETLAGTAYRKDLIIASTDLFEGDVVGTTVLGIDPGEVGYLKEFAQRHNRSWDISSIDIKGESLDDVRERLTWHFEPDAHLLQPTGISGIAAPSPGQTLCSGCGATLALALSIFAEDSPPINFDAIQLCYGLEVKPNREAKKVYLYGDCAIKSNRELPNAIKIAGCPPSLTRTLFVLLGTLLTKRKLLRLMMLEATRLIGIRFNLYRKEIFLRWQRYRAREFDKSHF